MGNKAPVASLYETDGMADGEGTDKTVWAGERAGAGAAEDEDMDAVEDVEEDEEEDVGAKAITSANDAAKVEAADQLLRNNALVFTKFAAENIDTLLEDLKLEQTYPVNETYKSDLISLVSKVFDIAVTCEPMPKGFYNRQLSDLRNALDSVVYISAQELFAAVQENVRLLRREQEARPYCLMVPKEREREKSNMLATFLAAILLRPVYAGCIDCDQDCLAINALGVSDCLLFDDCVYSGIQMKTYLYECRRDCWRAKFYAVPAFWHTPAPTDLPKDVTLKKDLHPAVRRAIAKRSRKLRAVSEFLDPTFWEVVICQKLTYLQTKQPDLVSFPPFLWSIRRRIFKNMALERIKTSLLFKSSAVGCSSSELDCSAFMYPKIADYGLKLDMFDADAPRCLTTAVRNLAGELSEGGRAKGTRSARKSRQLRK